MADALNPTGGDGGGTPAPTGNLDLRADPGAPPNPLSGPPPEPAPKGPDPAPKAPVVAKDPPPKAPTIADPPPVDPKDVKLVVSADWPETWREKMAGDNKKAIDRLARFKSPNEILNSYLALEAKVSGGEYAKKLPTHYTDAELADFRKANGIPDKPDDYNVDIPGIVWGEQDKPMLDSWKQFAHENHLPPEMVKLGPEWYAREQEALVARLAEDDMHNYQAGTAALQAEWGREFQGNINAARNMFEAHPGMWESVMSSRGADGMKLGDNPAVLKAFATIAKEMNPFATIAPAGGNTDPMKTLDTRMSEIKAMMADKSGPYWKGANAAAIQEEYRGLIDMQQRAEAARAGRRAA